MKKTAGILFCIYFSFLLHAQDFRAKQKKYSRVRTAYNEKSKTLTTELKKAGFQSLSNHILLIGYKKEMKLEVWIRDKTTKQYRYFKSYNFCSGSGVIGPKRKEGDLQIPEGFYNISHFNAWSNFYLSLKVNYPNESDKILGDKHKPGGDIYIHGACCTIGCIPITDDKIKELYVLCVEAIMNGQARISVYLFPCSLDEKSYDELNDKYKNEPEKLLFWKNLKEGYDYFILHEKIPAISVDKKGRYHFK